LFLKSQPALVLASTSPYRRDLLARLRLPFTTAAPQVEEIRLADESPLELATRLARAKARSVGAQRPGAWIIGSDQVAVRGDAILGKPGSHARCLEQLHASSGRTVLFLTAVAVVRDEAAHEFVDTTRVAFRSLDDETIARYVEAEAPLDCAGGFKSEGLGAALCDSIDTTDPTALIGLPLLRLAAALRSVGYRVP
jgi:septum formation protein